MGYNTQVLIINDALGEIEAHPEQFVRNLVSAIHRSASAWSHDHADIQVGNHGNAASVLPTAHADRPRVIVSEGNWMWEVRTLGDAFERAATEPHMRDEVLRRAKLARDAAQAVINKLEHGYQ